MSNVKWFETWIKDSVIKRAQCVVKTKKLQDVKKHDFFYNFLKGTKLVLFLKQVCNIVYKLFINTIRKGKTASFKKLKRFFYALPAVKELSV